MIALSQLPSKTVQTISLTAVIETALSVGAGGSSGSLADKPILKNGDGRLIIPASQLKGRLRHECEKLTRALGWPTCEAPSPQNMCPQLASKSEAEKRTFQIPPYQLKKLIGLPSSESHRHCLICQIFGNPSLPARLQCSDLVCDRPEEDIPEVLRPGVSINRRRKTAEDNKLFYLETSPANSALRFSGVLQLDSAWQQEGDPEPNFALPLILAGLKQIYALGGSKSAGLGWLHWEGLDSIETDLSWLEQPVPTAISATGGKS
ncbi:MAG: RAMP superfamily CRISPR-associated protein [Cyanobacteria bacterium J06623_5]